MTVLFNYLFLAFVLYKSAEAYVGILHAEEKPSKFADQEGCYIKKFDRMLSVDVPFSPQDGKSRCEEYTCKEDKQIHLKGCPPKIFSEECEILPVDLHQPFPDCCVRALCPAPNGTIIRV